METGARLTFNEWLKEWEKENYAFAGIFSPRIRENEEPGDSWTYRSWPVLEINNVTCDRYYVASIIEVLEKFLELEVEYN